MEALSWPAFHWRWRRTKTKQFPWRRKWPKMSNLQVVTYRNPREDKIQSHLTTFSSQFNNWWVQRNPPNNCFISLLLLLPFLEEFCLLDFVDREESILQSHCDHDLWHVKVWFTQPMFTELQVEYQVLACMCEQAIANKTSKRKFNYLLPSPQRCCCSLVSVCSLSCQASSAQ